MKKMIIGLEKDWMAFIYGILGILLIIFPEQFTHFVPYLLGLALIVHGIVGAVAIYKYKSEAEVKAGKVLITLVLGVAVLYNNHNALGMIGAIWAMLSLNEAAEEITESFDNKEFSLLRIFFTAVSVFLAILLLFNPFKHFVVHVRILGIEMILYVFVRKHKLRQKNKEAN